VRINTARNDAQRIDTLRINTLRINTAVDDVVVSSRAMHHATDSHSMPIPEPRARCTRHDRVVSGAPVAYMCAEAIRAQRVKRTPSYSLLDVARSRGGARSSTIVRDTAPPAGVARDEPRGIAGHSATGAVGGPLSGAEGAPPDGPRVLVLPQSHGP